MAITTTDSASDRGDANGSPTAPPTSGTVGVVVEGVRKQYGDCEALKGVSMEMECGEMTALLGMFLFLFLLKTVVSVWLSHQFHSFCFLCFSRQATMVLVSHEL